MPLQTMPLGELFTKQEIKRAVTLFSTSPKSFHRDCTEQIVRPALERINRVTGQNNDENYLAYVLEYAVQKHTPGA